MKSKFQGPARWKGAFAYSWAGFVSAFKSESAIREELAAGLILLPAAALLPVSVVERLFLFSGYFAMLGAELINTAIEAVVDRISSDRHPLSKKAKDVGSCLVLWAIIYLALVWITVLYNLWRG